MSEGPGTQDVKQIAAAVLGAGGQPPAEGWAAAGRQFRERTLQAAAAGFGPDQSGVPVSRFLCWAADALLKRIIPQAIAEAGSEDVQLAWVATGGYGRRLMSPGSTARLVALHDGREPQAVRAAADAVADLLRRAGYPAVCAAQTVEQVVERMRQDPVGAVAMLQTRRVAGSRNVYVELPEALLERLLRPSWGSFVQTVLGEVLSRRDPLTSSPYCTEPNLKEGAGCLRDVGTAQKMDEAISQLEGLPSAGGGNGYLLLSDDERADLSDALDFELGVRNRLHMLHGDRANLLQRRFQQQVAAALGYQDDAARLMRDLFAHTGRVCSVLQGMQERFGHLHRVAWRRAAQPPRRDLGEGFVEVAGRIYSAVQPPFPAENGGPRMVRLFLLSQRRHLPVSQGLLQQVRNGVDGAGVTLSSDEEAGRAFLSLLAGSVGVAERIGWMRDCGLLQAYLPELAPLVHCISPQAAGEFTLDEHAVEALRVIDGLGHSREPGTLAQRHALEQVQRVDLLRLGILLHHLDTATGHDPAQAVAAVTNRLGLGSRDRAELTFLTENQNLLRQCLESEGVSEQTVRNLAGRVADPERLRMLYLASYAHGRALGAPGRFAWRGPRLFELYQKAMAHLSPGYVPFATGEHFDRELLELAARDGVEEPAEKLRQIVPDLYKTEVSPAEALSHLVMIARLKQRPAAMRWRIGERDARVWVCTSDVPARFAQIAGVFTHAGLDILNATAFTLRDGTVLDRFIVRMKERPINPDPTFWERIEGDLVRSIRGEFDVSNALRARTAEEQRERAVTPHRLITSVRLENPAGLPVTALDVVARDRPGLLFDLSDALGREGLNIEYALIKTHGELAQDVFYVTDSSTGERITDEARLRGVRERIEEVTS